MTWSIVARDPRSGAFGICVATKSFCVGSRVPHMESGVGANATQANTNAMYGTRGIRLLREGGARERVERPRVGAVGVSALETGDRLLGDVREPEGAAGLQEVGRNSQRTEPGAETLPGGHRAHAAAKREGDAPLRRALERLRELGLGPEDESRRFERQMLQRAPELAGSEPARTNITARLTSFLGREDDRARVLDRMAAHRLVTLTGPGGVGKTSLALEAARLGGADMGGSLDRRATELPNLRAAVSVC